MGLIFSLRDNFVTLQMVHSISLDKSAQSTFTNAVKNIKALIKENELTIRDQNSSNAAKVTGKKAVLGRERKAADQQGGKPAWKDQGKGVVYLSHIPEGFCEEEMNSYFSQFGRVTRLNLVRSKKTGKPKGYAFIEFLYSEVAQVVAETMNNYLMCGKLLKAEYIPGDRTYRGMFRNLHIRPDKCPRRQSQKKWVQNINKKLTPEEEAGVVLHETRRLNKLKKQLEKSGINLDCQIEGGSLPLLNSVMSKTGEHPVLQIDESDSEVEFKVHPNVIRIVKRKSLPAFNPSSTEKKEKVQAEKDVTKKRVMKHRRLSASTYSPFVKKVKDTARKDVSKGRLQSDVISPVKRKSLSPSTLSHSLKRRKVETGRDVPKQDLQPTVSEAVECEPVSTSDFLPRLKKGEAEKENVSKRNARPSIPKAVKRRSSSASKPSPRVKEVTAKGKKVASSGTVMTRRFSSTSVLSPALKNVEGEVKKVSPKIKVQPGVTKARKYTSLSKSLPLPRVKRVNTEAGNNISKHKVQPDVNEVVKHTDLPTSLSSPRIRKVKADEGKRLSKGKVHSSATEVAKRRSLPSSLSSSVLSSKVRKAETDKGEVLQNVTKANKRTSLSSSSILSPKLRKVDANKGKGQQNVTKVVKRRSLTSPRARKMIADEGKHLVKRNMHPSTNDIVKRRSLSSTRSRR